MRLNMARIAKIRIVVEYEDQEGFSIHNLLDEGGKKDYPIEGGQCRKMILEADLMEELTLNLGKLENVEITFEKD